MADTTLGAAPPSKLPLILALVNSVIVLTAAGLLGYTKLVYKRPPITEQGERTRLEEQKKAVVDSALVSGTVLFDPFTVNIEASPGQPRPADGNPVQIQGKLHYATLGFGLEIRDQNRKDEIEELRPVILDKVISLLGRKAFQELTTVQGRYLLREQILDITNQLTAGKPGAGTDNLVTNVFFTHFVVQ